jgi:hypothetical protein
MDFFFTDLIAPRSCMSVALESSGAKESKCDYFYLLHQNTNVETQDKSKKLQILYAIIMGC